MLRVKCYLACTHIRIPIPDGTRLGRRKNRLHLSTYDLYEFAYTYPYQEDSDRQCPGARSDDLTVSSDLYLHVHFMEEHLCSMNTEKLNLGL